MSSVLVGTVVGGGKGMSTSSSPDSEALSSVDGGDGGYCGRVCGAFDDLVFFRIGISIVCHEDMSVGKRQMQIEYHGSYEAACSQ